MAITYRYKCSDCGEYDVKQRITEQPLDICVICMKNKVYRVQQATFAPHIYGIGAYKQSKRDNNE